MAAASSTTRTGPHLHPVGVQGNNTLTITFGAELGISTGGRFTHSTQIDWAPTMTTKECWSKDCLSTFGFGIWKSVYLVPMQDTSAAIMQLIPHTYYAGPHPTTLLHDDTHQGFTVVVRAELLVGTTGGQGTLSVVGSWPGATPVHVPVALPPGRGNVTVTIPSAQTLGVGLWNPHGHGSQTLYNITATYTPASGESVTTTRRFGFRHVALVTVNDTDASVVAAANNSTGTGQFTMFFRVNGAAVYARGANKVWT